MNINNLLIAPILLGALVTGQVQADDGDQALAQGSLQSAFSSWGKPALRGDWQIVEDAGTYFLELGENFRAKNGPDVKIFLSPTAAGKITGDNAVNGSVLVEQISSFDGSARIAIPAGVDPSKFQSLVFHCEAYSKLWGTAPLR